MLFFLSLIETEEEKTLFARIYEEYRQKMFQYALFLLKDEGNAEDIVHEVFLSIAKSGVRKLSDIVEDGSIWAYLSAAVRNQCASFQRRQGGVRPTEPVLLESLRGAAADPTAEAENYWVLLEKLRALPEIYADVLYFALVRDMPVNQIASLLGVKPAAVRKRLSRGREMLRRILEQEALS